MKHKNLLYSFLVIIIMLAITFFITRRSKMENSYNDADVAGEIQQKYLRHEDHNIYYEIIGDSDKTLFFIHGWGGSTSSWKYQLDSFKDYKVIAMDLPGHGQSSKDKNTNYNMELFADSVAEVLKKEGIEKAFFFGHSMGFAISEIVALKYPELCVGIGSIDGAHFEVPEDEKAQKDWIAYNRFFAESMNEEKGREDFINALFLPDTPQILKDEIFSTSQELPLSIGKAIIGSMENNMEFWGKRVMDIPCLAIHSPVYQLTEEYKNDFMTMYPKAEYYEIENVSHFLMMEMPYRINQMMLDYLEKVY